MLYRDKLVHKFKEILSVAQFYLSVYNCEFLQKDYVNTRKALDLSTKAAKKVTYGGSKRSLINCSCSGRPKRKAPIERNTAPPPSWHRGSFCDAIRYELRTALPYKDTR